MWNKCVPLIQKVSGPTVRPTLTKELTVDWPTETLAAEDLRPPGELAYFHWRTVDPLVVLPVGANEKAAFVGDLILPSCQPHIATSAQRRGRIKSMVS